MHPELFNKESSLKPQSNKIVQSKKNEESDSDSDYEYFKVQKEIDNKNNTKSNEDENDEITNEDLIDNNIFAKAIKTAVTEDELVLPATVNQTFIVVPMKLRLVTLCSLIVEHCVLNKKGGKMIVFMATLEMVDYHSELIETALTGKKIKKKGNSQDSNVKKGKNCKEVWLAVIINILNLLDVALLLLFLNYCSKVCVAVCQCFLHFELLV